MQLILKRLAVWLVEISAEAFLIAMFCIAWFGISNYGFATDLRVLLVGTAGLFMSGTYYLWTTAVLRLAWRNPTRLWLYSSVSAVLIIAHLQVFFFRSGWDLSMRLTIQAGAACAAFGCTFAGGWVLRKWLRSRAAGPGARTASV